METIISHANKEALPLFVFTSFGLKKPLFLPTLNTPKIISGLLLTCLACWHLAQIPEVCCLMEEVTVGGGGRGGDGGTSDRVCLTALTSRFSTGSDMSTFCFGWALLCSNLNRFALEKYICVHPKIRIRSWIWSEPYRCICLNLAVCLDRTGSPPLCPSFPLLPRQNTDRTPPWAFGL